MTPFDPNLPPNADQPLDQDDLIAFHLHELPRAQVRAVNRTLRNNPQLQAESIAIATTLRAFSKHEPSLPLDAAALDRHWQTLLPSLTPHTPTTIPPRSFFPRTLFPRWTLPTLAASALVAITLLVAWHYTRRTQPSTITTTATLSSTTPTLTPPATSQPNPPTNSQSNPFNPLPMTPRRAWPSTAAPLETATANPPAPIFPTQPTPLSTTTPSTPSTQPDTLQPTNPTPSQPTVQSSTQPLAKPGKPLRASTPHRPASNELTFGIFGDLAIASRATLTDGTGASATTQSVSQSPGATVGALASFRQQFSPFRGYLLTGTYVSPSSGSTGLKIYEAAGTYVVQGPHGRRLTTSAEAGAALVATTYDNSHTFRPAAVIGIGSELALSSHWGLRAEYRAQFYKSPALFSAIAPLGVSVSSSNNTFDSNAIVGVTYLFGRRSSD